MSGRATLIAALALKSSPSIVVRHYEIRSFNPCWPAAVALFNH